MKNKKKRMSTAGFILSAIGTAVGLGNIWGFPTKMIEFGGPAFLIPYIVAIIILGLPVLILEMNMGSFWRKTPIKIYQKYWGMKGKFFGWFQSSMQLLIGTYYAIIMAWLLISAFSAFQFSNDWSFYETVLGDDGSVTNITDFSSMGGINLTVLGAVIGVFVLVWIIIYLGISNGIEKTNKVIMPLLFIMIIGFVFYSVLSLDNAKEGLNLMFKPDFSKITNYRAWASAFGQAFFSLSLVLATMVVYSSSSPEGGDNSNRAIIIASGDSLIALLSCIIIGATIGYAKGQGLLQVEIPEGGAPEIHSLIDGKVGPKLNGSGLIFEIFPKTFASLNEKADYLGSILGMLFYIALFFAAISSLIGLIEPTAAGLIENNKFNRFKAASVGVLIQFIFGFIYWFNYGHRTIVNVADGIFVTNFILISAFIELSVIAFSWTKLSVLTKWNNKNSYLKLNKWYYFLLLFGIVLILAIFGLGIYKSIEGIINNGDEKSDFYQITSFQWIITSCSLIVPLFLMTLGLGLLGEKEKKADFKLLNKKV